MAQHQHASAGVLARQAAQSARLPACTSRARCSNACPPPHTSLPRIPPPVSQHGSAPLLRADVVQAAAHKLLGQRLEAEARAARLQGRDDLGHVVADEAEARVARVLLHHCGAAGRLVGAVGMHGQAGRSAHVRAAGATPTPPARPRPGLQPHPAPQGSARTRGGAHRGAAPSARPWSSRRTRPGSPA